MNRQIFRLAIPNIISNISVPLLNLIDLAILGHLGSDVYIGAVALGNTIFNFIFWTLAFLRMGTSGMTAQSFGRNDFKEASLLLARAVLVAVSTGLLVILLQYPVAWLSFKLMNGSAAVEECARSYFYIKVYATPAAVALFALSGWFIGMQNSKIPMILAIFTNALNILLSLLFVFVFNLKANGVALSFVFANYFAVLLAVWFFLRKYQELLKHWILSSVLQLKSLVLFFNVNKDIFLRMLCIVTTFTFFTNQSASVSDTYLAANSILLQFLMFFSYLIDGFAYAGEALVGKFIGAENRRDLKQVIRKLLFWGAILGLCFSAVYAFAGKAILHLLTNDEALISFTSSYLLWAACIPLVSFLCFTWDGIYIGATASREMRNTMFIATFLVFFPLWFIFDRYIGNNSLWLAMISFMASRGVMQTFLARKAILGKVKNR